MSFPVSNDTSRFAASCHVRFIGLSLLSTPVIPLWSVCVITYCLHLRPLTTNLCKSSSDHVAIHFPISNVKYDDASNTTHMNLKTRSNNRFVSTYQTCEHDQCINSAYSIRSKNITIDVMGNKADGGYVRITRAKFCDTASSLRKNANCNKTASTRTNYNFLAHSYRIVAKHGTMISSTNLVPRA